MKKFILFAACALALVACEKGGGEVTNDKEQEFAKVMTPYVNNTVLATYQGMADEGQTLLEKCELILSAQEKGTDYSALMTEAQTSWRAMRKYWEQSEAFLYGPADQYNIDPRVDSWPLDFNAMNALLNDATRMAEIETHRGSAVGKLDYALKGFHAAEYLLFTKTTLTHPEAVFLVALVDDLADQSALLVTLWETYGQYMIDAGQTSSIYKSYQEAAEQIIAGCIDIAGEVADLKMGNPYLSSTEEEREYIESPYSHTSTIDFADNITSIRNSYCGAKDGEASISDYVKAQDETIDTKVRKAINEAIIAISNIENFETTAKNNPKVKNAIDKVSALEEVLNKEVLPLLSK
ncbi:MAG: hypothetical protein IKT19_00115 [Paludibacteraceae bacterium]|nr:hypothetical protein [Paludibacteraceae bacterium]